MDPQNLVDNRLFTFVLNHEIHKASRLRYPVSILCLAPDLTRGAAPSSALRRVARQAVSHVRATDLATKLDGHGVALLLVDAETRTLPVILERLKAGLEPISGLTLSAGGGCYPQTATSGSEVLQQAIELMTRAKAEGGNRLYLPRGP